MTEDLSLRLISFALCLLQQLLFMCVSVCQSQIMHFILHKNTVLGDHSPGSSYMAHKQPALIMELYVTCKTANNLTEKPQVCVIGG